MKTLLLVDDENDIREELSRFINHHCGVRVLEAANGRQTIDSYKTNHPDCVFLDLGLPDMNGLKVLEDIKAQDPQAKVYILSGCDDAGPREKAKALGAAGYLTKPVVFGELLAALAAV